MAEVSECQAVPAERMSEESRLQARSLQIRGRLGQELYDLVKPDLPEFYEKVRDMAFARSHTVPRNPDGRPARSAAQVQLSAMRLFYSLIKMVNSDMNVDRADFNGDAEVLLKQLRKMETEDLAAMEKKVAMLERAARREEEAYG